MKDRKKFEEIFNKFIRKLELKRIKFDTIEYDDDPGKIITFHQRGLKKYKLGFWPCGKWFNYYNVQDDSKVSIFMIHSWNLDKFRPSSADILFEVYVNQTNDIDLELGTITDEIEKIKNNPIKTYYEITTIHHYKSPVLEYYSTYFNIVSYECKGYLEYNLTPKLLYGILKFISIFDRRVKKSKCFDEKSVVPRYTFSFLATIECANNLRSWKKFCDLYYRFPVWLKRKTGHRMFDAVWSVADYDEDMSEKEIKIRMWKGVVVE